MNIMIGSNDIEIEVHYFNFSRLEDTEYEAWYLDDNKRIPFEMIDYALYGDDIFEEIYKMYCSIRDQAKIDQYESRRER
jgi:hypothetical protein